MRCGDVFHFLRRDGDFIRTCSAKTVAVVSSCTFGFFPSVFVCVCVLCVHHISLKCYEVCCNQTNIVHMCVSEFRFRQWHSVCLLGTCVTFSGAKYTFLHVHVTSAFFSAWITLHTFGFTFFFHGTRLLVSAYLFLGYETK